VLRLIQKSADPSELTVQIPEFGWCETCDNGRHWQCFIVPIPNGQKPELTLNFDELSEKQQYFAWPRLMQATHNN